MNSTKSIAKITKSMKMVAAAKLNVQKRKLAEGDAFGVSDFTHHTLYTVETKTTVSLWMLYGMNIAPRFISNWYLFMYAPPPLASLHRCCPPSP
jgi:hypothetical protein